MSTERNYYDIIAGPGKDLLFDACKYAYTKDAKIPVDFAVVKADQNLIFVTDFVVNSIQYEDGSGCKFNLGGYCKANLGSEPLEGEPKGFNFKAFYDTKKRTGFIIFRD
ncbi:hypothetical protein IKF32_02855 [Candidatus Saccharibacteria bacterium]|nr:hypothetical protein [Candidatus Saccharibacteria bacterium]